MQTRPAASAPDESAQDLPFNATVESDQPVAVHVNALARAIFDYQKGLQDSGLMPTLPPECQAALLHMSVKIDPTQLPRLVVACSRTWLAEITGRHRGHVGRCLNVLRQDDFLLCLRKGGKHGNQGEPTLYLLIPKSAPAHRAKSAQAHRANSALARHWGPKNRVRRRAHGKQSLLSTSVVVVTTTEAEKERAVELLRKEVDEPTAKALVALPEATEGQVTIALKCLDEYRASGHKVKNVGALLRRAITQKWTPGMSPEERREAARPEHVQEQSAIERQQRAELDAKERAALELVKYCPDAELVKHIATAAAAHQGTVAQVYGAATPETIRQPNMFVGLRPEVAKLIKAAAKQGVP